MVDILSMVDLTSISAILAAIGVFVGVIFAVLQLRDLVKTRQTDLVMRLFSTFGSKEFQEAYEKISTMEIKDYNDLVRKGYQAKFYTVGSFFEGIGVLLRRKLVDIGLVEDLFRESIKSIWEKARPIAEDFRKQFNQPHWGRSFEYLCNEMQKREQQLTTIQ